MLPPVGLLAPARFVGGVARHAAGPWGPYPILLRLLEATGRRGRAPKRRPIRQSPRPGAAAARRPKRPTRRLRPDPAAPRATRTALSAALKNARLRARWVVRAKRGRNHGCRRGPPRARIEPASFAELPPRMRYAQSVPEHSRSGRRSRSGDHCLGTFSIRNQVTGNVLFRGPLPGNVLFREGMVREGILLEGMVPEGGNAGYSKTFRGFEAKAEP